MRFRLGLAVGFGFGYYLGARAGRARYEQLRGLVARTPLAKFQAAVDLGRERLRNGAARGHRRAAVAQLRPRVRPAASRPGHQGSPARRTLGRVPRRGSSAWLRRRRRVRRDTREDHQHDGGHPTHDRGREDSQQGLAARDGECRDAPEGEERAKSHAD